MEDDLKFSGNGRRPQFFRKWNTTPTLIKFKFKTTSASENRRRHQYFRKWKMTLIFQEKEDGLNFSGNGRQPQFLVNGRRLQLLRKWKTTSTSEK
jgi:hypothetical protein